MYTPSRRMIAATAALASALFLAGCADDDDPIASPSEPVSATPTQSAAPSIDEFCDAKVAIDAAFLAGGPPEEEGDATPSPEQIKAGIEETWSGLYEELARTAAPEAKTSVDTLVSELDEAIEAANPEFFFEPEFAAADRAVDDFLVEQCDFNELSGTTVDYEFENLPTVAQAGVTALKITNEGDEFHEILLMRINDGVEESIQELLELDEEEANSKIRPMGVVLAMPGTSAINFFDLEPGRYAALCFISKDSDAEHDFQGEGPPHFTEGMVEEIEVVDPNAPSAEPTETSGSVSGSASEAEETSSPSDSGAATSSEDEEETSSPDPTTSSG